MNIAEEFVSRMPADVREHYAAMLEAAALDGPVIVEPEALAEFVSPAQSLLARAASGITVTAAAETPADRSRRDQLVASALLRAENGILKPTPIGTALSAPADSPRLWRHLAATVANATHEISSDGVTALLLLVASGTYAGDYQDRISSALSSLGWRSTDGEPLEKWDAFEAVVSQFRFLSHAGAVTTGEGGTAATPIGIEFARTALQVEAV